MTALGTAQPETRSDGSRVLTPVPVWPGGAPENRGAPGQAAVLVQEELRENGRQIWNVTQPSYQAFLPAPARATGTAVIIAPGGGFRFLSMVSEGNLVAEWLTDHGIAAFVLKYRLIQTLPGETAEQMRVRINTTMPLGTRGEPGAADGIEALRLIRARAGEYGIDPSRVGVVGFSAGGHVAGKMALAADPQLRPAFAGLIYGMPFDDTKPKLPPASLPYPPGTPEEPWLRPAPTPAPGRLPPLFMAMAQDDVLAGAGFRVFYDNLIAQNYYPELHLYQRGNHGFGMNRQGGTSDHWLQEFVWWIEGEGLMKASPKGADGKGD